MKQTLVQGNAGQLVEWTLSQAGYKEKSGTHTLSAGVRLEYIELERRNYEVTFNIVHPLFDISQNPAMTLTAVQIAGNWVHPDTLKQTNFSEMVSTSYNASTRTGVVKVPNIPFGSVIRVTSFDVRMTIGSENMWMPGIHLGTVPTNSNGVNTTSNVFTISMAAISAGILFMTDPETAGFTYKIKT